MIIRHRNYRPDEPGTGSGSGSGDGPAPSGANGGQGTGSEGGQGGNGGQGGTGTGSGSGGNDWRIEDLPQGAREYISGLRSEAAGHRQAKGTAEQSLASFTDTVKQALGLSEAPSADQLAEQLRSAQAETRQARVETAIARGAGTHGANAAALLDRVSFLRTVQELDPSASDFSTKVDEAIKAAVAADPTVRTAPSQAEGEHGSGEQNGGARRPAPDSSQGSSGSGNGGAPKTVQAGRDLYAKRHPAKAASGS